MNLDDVQSRVAANIQAAPELAAFGAPLLFSPFTDEDASRQAIADRLRATGVCIEVGNITLTGMETIGNGLNLAMASVAVFIAEGLRAAHLPRAGSLVAAVVEAVTARQLPRALNQFRLSSYYSGREHGYALGLLTFSVPITIS